MRPRLRDRLAREDGYTLVELRVVIVIIVVLLAVAASSYLGFTDRAETRVAQANVRAAVPAVEAYSADYNGYADVPAAAAPAGLPAGDFTAAGLKAHYDHGLPTTGSKKVKITGSGMSYCISAEGKSGEFWVKSGPGADIVRGSAGLAGGC